MDQKFKNLVQKISWKAFRWTCPDEKTWLYNVSLNKFKKQLMDPRFDSAPYENIDNEYFKQFGFRFSQLESEFYSQCTGVRSNLYIPIGLWDWFIYPYLNKNMWRVAYCDKNMFHRLLDINEAKQHIDIQMPECVIYCDNGRFFDGNDTYVGRERAIEILAEVNEDIIIKPTLDSSHGQGVQKVHVFGLNKQEINALIDTLGDNFVCQKVIKQHPNLAAYNPTSVNTIRITTYQDFKGNIKVLYASQRFGSTGKVYDNADDPNGDGGFCVINPDGSVKREVHHYRRLDTTFLDESVPGITPAYDKVVEAVLFLHTRFPQFALIGWDMTVTEDGHPLVIEYNFAPGLGTCQFAHGPMFSKEDLDEIMEHISKHQFAFSVKKQISFTDKPDNTLIR